MNIENWEHTKDLRHHWDLDILVLLFSPEILNSSKCIGDVKTIKDQEDDGPPPSDDGKDSINAYCYRSQKTAGTGGCGGQTSACTCLVLYAG